MAFTSSPQRGYLTSGFSRKRLNPATKKYAPHLGSDYGSKGEKVGVYAYTSGVVVAVGWNILAGRTGYGVLIQHNSSNHRTYYGHLSHIAVSAGDVVWGGRRIGTSGDTGNVTGVHLHFEYHTRVLGVWIAQDPVKKCARLGGIPAVAAWKPVERNDKGSYVRKVQKALGLKQDGVFGPVTKSAVRKFQNKHGLTVDGIVGRTTAARMGLI